MTYEKLFALFHWIVLLVCGLGVHALTAQETAPVGRHIRPTIGAIRWDAWFGNNGVVGKAVHRSLGPSKWHNRLPFYAKDNGDDNVEIDGTPQSVIDREIEYAAGAGLDYWAFVTYPGNEPLSLALTRYLESPIRSKINFCLITECTRWLAPEFVDRVVSLVQEPGYQRVTDGRPLLYLGFIKSDQIKAFGGIEGFRKTLDDFRAMVSAKGLPRPYVVIMDFSPTKGQEWANQLGADAISSYVAGIGNGEIPYTRMAGNAELFWEKCRETGKAVVPIAVTGWDPRPRIERPMPWGNPYGTHDGEVNRAGHAAPADIANHLGNTLRWLANHREAAPAQTAIVYAWNEFDEGGWLAPTLAEGTARIDAIARVLRPASASRPLAVSSSPSRSTCTQPAARINLLFAYFTGNGEDGLRLAFSHDGFEWEPLNDGKPFVTPGVGRQRLMRDPFLMQGKDGVFHLSWSSGWGEKGFGLAHSRDLIEWSPQQQVPVMEHEPAAVNCWAPEIVYDDQENRYILYWSTTIPGRFPATDGTGDRNQDGTPLNHRIYCTTTTDFRTFTLTKLLYDGGFNAIDANIVKDGKRWLMFIKDETLTPTRKDIRMATSNYAMGPYGPASRPITMSWTEGPAAIRFADRWFLYFDQYTRHRYGLMCSQDLEHWDDLSNRLGLPTGARHGSVLTVSDEILSRLLAMPRREK